MTIQCNFTISFARDGETVRALVLNKDKKIVHRTKFFVGTANGKMTAEFGAYKLAFAAARVWAVANLGE